MVCDGIVGDHSDDDGGSEGDQFEDEQEHREDDPEDNDFDIELDALLAGLLEEALDEEPGAAIANGQDTASSDANGMAPGVVTSRFADEPVAGHAAGSSNDPMPGSWPPAPSPGQLVLAAVAPAPPPPVPAAELRGPRSRGLHTVRFIGGKVIFYPDKRDPSKGRFEATCGNIEAHGAACRLTRASHAPKNALAHPAQGRPLGLMAAWLAHSFYPSVETQTDHAAMLALLSHDLRASSRAELVLEENGEALAACERPRREGENDEPEEQA